MRKQQPACSVQTSIEHPRARNHAQRRLTASASPIALPPSGPILLSERFSVCNVLFTCNAQHPRQREKRRFEKSYRVQSACKQDATHTERPQYTQLKHTAVAIRAALYLEALADRRGALLPFRACCCTHLAAAAARCCDAGRARAARPRAIWHMHARDREHDRECKLNILLQLPNKYLQRAITDDLIILLVG